jgi:type IV pilus assembly protein PilE
MTRKRPAGFTLMELVIVVAVIGILAAVALPAYFDQMRKGRRAAAEAHLMDIVAKQQTYLLDTRGYAPDLATLNVTTPPEVSPYYQITFPILTAGPPPAFTVAAAPLAGQNKDFGGKSLTVTNTGVRGPCVSGGAYSDAPCAAGTVPAW